MFDTINLRSSDAHHSYRHEHNVKVIAKLGQQIVTELMKNQSEAFVKPVQELLRWRCYV